VKFLIDEMFPPHVARDLRELGHDAVHVTEVGLAATSDPVVAAFARTEHRAIVTENVVDYAAERDVALVFVLKKNLPPGRPHGAALVSVLDDWARTDPAPYLGPHWPG